MRSIACCLVSYVTLVYTNVYGNAHEYKGSHRLSRIRIHAYTRQITGKWPEQQISLIYFNFSTRTGLLVWILCARMNYCEVIFEFVLIYERLLGASCALYRRYKGGADRYVEMRKDSSKFRTLYIRRFYREFS